MYLKNKLSKLSLFSIYICAVIALYVLPILKYHIPYAIAGSFLLIGFVYVFFKLDKQNQMSFLTMTAICFFLSVILFINQYGFDIIELFNNFICNLRFFFPCFLMLYGHKIFKKVDLILIISFTFLLFFYISFNTLVAVHSNPEIARLLANPFNEALSSVRDGNVGGFGFCYAFGLLIIFFFYMFLTSKSKILKIVFLLFIAYGFYFEIKVQYFILIVLTLFSCLILYFYNAYKNKSIILNGAILAIGIIAIVLFLPKLIENQAILADKLEVIKDFFETGNIDALRDRPELFLEGLSGFIKAPIFGLHNAQVRPHSTFVSYLCCTGLIGFLGYLSLWILGSKKSLSIFKHSNNKILLIISIIYVVVLGIINPIDYIFELSLLLFIFIPSIIKLFDKTNKQINFKRNGD